MGIEEIGFLTKEDPREFFARNLSDYIPDCEPGLLDYIVDFMVRSMPINSRLLRGGWDLIERRLDNPTSYNKMRVFTQSMDLAEYHLLTCGLFTERCIGELERYVQNGEKLYHHTFNLGSEIDFTYHINDLSDIFKGDNSMPKIEIIGKMVYNFRKMAIALLKVRSKYDGSLLYWPSKIKNRIARVMNEGQPFENENLTLSGIPIIPTIH